MSTSRFFAAFTAAINWNALFYVVYKICFVALTFILYQKLPSFYFSQWATANSIIFLLLLWLNCGLKKSIPRFAPVFSKNTALHKKFVQYLLLIKFCILAAGLPLLLYALHIFIPNLAFLPLISILFVTEGVTSLLMLVYHAHFWQKQFNLIQAFFLLLEMTANMLYLCFFNASPLSIVSFLFISKIISNFCTILFSVSMLPLFYRATTIPSHEPLDTRALVRAFLKHSFFMWIIGLSESLSERNFLFPFITRMQGFSTANLFKVVHDAAIFFQRIAIKTIGVADTALLSYIEVTDNRLSLIKSAFTAIFKTMFTLCIPLFCLGSVFFFKNHSSVSWMTTTLFLVVTCGSAFEMILSPYTRVLEVKLRYKELFLSYLPYTLGYLILMLLYALDSVSLLVFITCTHLLRISGVLAMNYFAKKEFNVIFPISFSSIIVGISFLLTLIAWTFF